MKWYWWVLKILIGVSLVILIVLLMGGFVLIIEVPELILLKEVREMTWQWAEWHPWIIVFWFFWIYLAIGMAVGIELEREYLLKYRKEKKYLSLICSGFKVVLMSVGWSPYMGKFAWDFYLEELG